MRKLGRELPRHTGQNGDLRCLSIRAEQYPEPDRRVRLSERQDALGMPTVELDWEVSSADRSALLARLETVSRSFEDTGLGRVLEPISGWEDMLVGGPHHLGTTRMSEGPETGVVDRDCRVHGVENLYVAGSSVFATGGWANPTFSVIALALRLAAHLVGEPVAAVSEPASAAVGR